MNSNSNVEEVVLQKRSRGRPRKHPKVEKTGESKGRGRPRKYPILEKERLPNGEIKPTLKKVESIYLIQHMVVYFTKLLILHHELAKHSPQHEAIFKRLKTLDFQMAEICKTVMRHERPESTLAENEHAA